MSQSNSTGAIGTSGYLVRQGDCIENIAEKHGLCWRTIWDAPENAKLKSIRKNPNTLLPGDKVFLPEKKPNHLDCATDSRHRFLRKDVPSELRVIIRCAGKPVKDTPYNMNIDGVFVEGKTGADGMVRQKINPNATKCKLTVGTDPDVIVYEIHLGNLDPISELSGVQNRLINLGYDASESRGPSCPETIGAIRDFQSNAKLAITGEMDNATRDALENAYGG
jgi:N-acetylmuramoyl-L-alanine amidase